ncbi:VOC family protein [Cellulomonas sp. HZM]|uniref:VOC family protein n=1 Tax=Cellulomonas sp. HZM TaxID=1454010 RepID=UPI0004934187|nr:VOC family protein [Cellulomonas sp. HZM]
MTDDEQGLTPAAFHTRPGVEDWRVTSWGAQACFRAGSLAQAAALVAPVVDAASRLGVAPDVDLRPEAVVVRIPHRDGLIPVAGAEAAAAVSVAARELGLRPDVDLVQTVDIYVAHHPDRDVEAFWEAALGYVPSGVDDAVDPLRRGPSLSFHPDMERTGRGRTHIDVSVPADRAEARVAAALAAGGRLVDDSYAPQWWTIASPDNHGIDIAAWTDTHD